MSFGETLIQYTETYLERKKERGLSDKILKVVCFGKHFNIIW